MGKDTHISWADHTFNPWIGCTKVSPACDGCYAENLMDTRMGRVKWGAGEARSRTAPSNWSQPRKWNKAAIADGSTPFVFCASLADVFDNEVAPEWRHDLFDLIRATPALTWLLLTKRIGNAVKLYNEAMLDPPDGGSGYPWPRNAALGATIINQGEADRDARKLLQAAQELAPAFTFVSIEPMLGPIDLTCVKPPDRYELNALSGFDMDSGAVGPHIEWVITGGETDQGAHRSRPHDPDWFRSLRAQCERWGVPFHHKQNGEWLEGVKVGKDHAGRLLDGIVHDARPVVKAVSGFQQPTHVMDDATKAAREWPCGHPRTPENTQSIGVAGLRCRECRRQIALASFHRVKARQALTKDQQP